MTTEAFLVLLIAAISATSDSCPMHNPCTGNFTDLLNSEQENEIALEPRWYRFIDDVTGTPLIIATTTCTERQQNGCEIALERGRKRRKDTVAEGGGVVREVCRDVEGECCARRFDLCAKECGGSVGTVYFLKLSSAIYCTEKLNNEFPTETSTDWKSLVISIFIGIAAGAVICLTIFFSAYFILHFQSRKQKNYKKLSKKLQSVAIAYRV